MGKSKQTTAQKTFHQDVTASLSSRLEQMQKQFQGVAEGVVVINSQGDLTRIADQVRDMVAEAQALEERPEAETFITNAGAVQAAILIYELRDRLREFDRSLAERQRTLIEKHREPNVDPDGSLGRGFEEMVGELQKVRLLVASGSEVRQ
ncbi:hypothetical protein [Aureimonas sp. SK2]|uniref:hypothetical protein n=1 Tax=Aureimonas sp. SK2 TaxID=3015992 RepID=UPI002443D025|nr:hypothetical protein [Aureimonas sp. SK2]